MSHDINRDPEMWEFRDLVGPRADPIWEEILSIADRNEGRLPGALESYQRLLAGACHSTPSRVRVALEWLTTPPHTWLTVESDLSARVTNHAKYHISKEDKENPTRNPKASPPNHPNQPIINNHKNDYLFDPKTFPLPDGIKEESWLGFVRMRERSKRPLETSYQCHLLVQRLEQIKACGDDPNECLDRSTRTGSPDVYPPRKTGIQELNARPSRSPTQIIEDLKEAEKKKG